MVQPSSWGYLRLGAVRYGYVGSRFGFIEVLVARNPSGEFMGRPQLRGAVLGVRAFCYRWGVTANVR